jgi:catechol 2,3-dioxygenase-like lactoylglutathione lyase family enzyme
MALTGLSHVGLSTPDLERCLAFYRDGLAFHEIVRFGWEAGNTAADAGLGLADTAATIVVLNAGNTYLEVLHFTSPIPVRLDEPPTLFREGITHIALEVDDAAEAARRVETLGGLRVDRDPASTSPAHLVRDPDGNLIELRSTRSTPLDLGTRAIAVPHDSDEAARRPRHAAHGPTDIRGLHHVGVCTRDADRTATFYLAAGATDVDDVTWDLGTSDALDVSRGVARQGRARVLGFGNAYLELLQYKGVAVEPRPDSARIIEYGFNHLCVDVDDIATTHAELLERGMTCHAPWVVMPGGHAAMGYALDVQGTPIELLEHRSTQSTMWPGHLTIPTA